MRTTAFLLFACLTVAGLAQNDNPVSKELKPGTIISGRVVDASTNEPLGPNAFIIETVENDTAAYYYTVTDRDGRFSYPLYGTDHVIKVRFKDYKTVKVPLDKTYFEIKMEKSPSGFERDGVMYQMLESYFYVKTKTGNDTLIIWREGMTIYDLLNLDTKTADKTGDDTLKNVRVPNIRILKTGRTE